MIIRSRRKSESLWRRILQAAFPLRRRRYNGVVSADAMRYELARETSRSNRRSVNREFALVILRFLDDDARGDNLEGLVDDFMTRLRISDTIGWFDENLALLLPETDREGAMLVANDLAITGLMYEIRIDTEIQVYPWDDEFVSVANELKQDVENQTDGHEVADELAKNGQDLVGVETDSDLAQCIGSQQVIEAPVGHKMRAQMFAFQPPLATPWWKRTVDIVGSIVGLICLSPVFVLAAIAIKLDGPGPIFFRQRREGKDGKCFEMWKFRTMHLDADDQKESLRHISEQDGPAFKLADDPRVTPIGRYLRKSCVDEMPQLLNVLRGQMSLVGPRPLPVDESVACKAWQRHRLRVLPGLTCIWQVDGSRSTRFDDWMRMDMQYLRQRSFLYDLKLIFRTAFLAIAHRGSV